MSSFISLFALNFQMLFTIHYVAWLINRVSLEEKKLLLYDEEITKGDSSGRLKPGVCALWAAEKSQFPWLPPPLIALLSFSCFPFLKNHNINSSTFPPLSDYIIPAACENKTKPHHFECEEECKMPTILFCKYFGDYPRKQVAHGQSCVPNSWNSTWHKCGCMDDQRGLPSLGGLPPKPYAKRRCVVWAEGASGTWSPHGDQGGRQGVTRRF